MIALPLRAALLASCLLTVTALVPHASAEEQAPGTFGIAVVDDLTGDGLADVVELGRPILGTTEVGPRVEVNDEDPIRLAITGRRGTDGEALWSTVLEPHSRDRAKIVPSALGPDTPGVLVTSGSFEDDLYNTLNLQYLSALAGARSETDSAHATAVNARTGQVVWHLNVQQGANGFVLVEDRDISRAAHARVDGEYVNILGTGQYTGTPATDVLVAVATRVQAGPAGAGVTRLLAVDGSTGELVTLAQLASAGGPTTARALNADMDQDGFLDIAVRETQATDGFGVLSAATGRLLWVQPLVRSESNYTVQALPDLSGDGKQDIAFIDDPVYLDYDLVNEKVTVLNGTTGAVLQKFERDIVLAEDRDGDGRAELLLADVSGENLVLTVVDGTGRTLRTRTAGKRGSAYPIGDINADGHTDLAVGPLPDAQPTSPYVLDGRTLAARLIAEPWIGLGSSLDADGDDVITVNYDDGTQTTEALDARTGGSLWRTERAVDMRGGGLFLLGATIADLTGDGVDDVTVNGYVTNNADEAFTVTALDGATGRVLFRER